MLLSLVSLRIYHESIFAQGLRTNFLFFHEKSQVLTKMTAASLFVKHVFLVYSPHLVCKILMSHECSIIADRSIYFIGLR